MANYVNSPNSDGDVQLVSGRCKLKGLSAKETSGTAGAKFVLRDGTSTSGTAVLYVNIGSDGTVNGDIIPSSGIEFRTGIFLDRLSGAVDVTAFV